MKVIFVVLALTAAANAASPRATCAPPACSNTTKLFPHNDPTKYYQCRPILGCDAWGPIEMPCPKGSWFSPQSNRCEDCRDKGLWGNPCNLVNVPECECEVPPTSQPPPPPTTPPTTPSTTPRPTVPTTSDNPGPIEGEPCPPENCKGNPKLLYPNLNDPTTYYACVGEPGCEDNNKPVLMRCPYIGVQLYFDYRLQRCEWCKPECIGEIEGPGGECPPCSSFHF